MPKLRTIQVCLPPPQKITCYHAVFTVPFFAASTSSPAKQKKLKSEKL